MAIALASRSFLDNNSATGLVSFAGQKQRQLHCLTAASSRKLTKLNDDDNMMTNSNAERLSSFAPSPSVAAADDSRSVIVFVDCVVIGAGAAGLQCAADLLSKKRGNQDNGKAHLPPPPPLVCILEARDRVGGRIHTVTETVNGHVFVRDLGAAWVHGTGNVNNNNSNKIKINNGSSDDEDGDTTDDTTDDDDEGAAVDGLNPMVQLLLDRSHGKHGANDGVGDDKTQRPLLEDGSGSCQPYPFLDPIFWGNPETRPNTVLLARPNQLALFVEGQQIPQDAPVVSKAIQDHYRLLRDLDDVCHQEGGCVPSSLEDLSVEQAVTKLQEKRKNTTTATNDDKPTDGIKEQQDDDPLLLQLLTPFFRFLLTNWHGTSLTDMQVEFVLPLDADSGSEDSGGSDVSKTDEDYVCDGDFEGPHCKVKEGMSVILEPLVDRIRAQSQDAIRLNEAVVRIVDDPDRHRVRIETACGTVVEAKCCVSTIPLGCLQHATTPASLSSPAKSLFWPPLEPAKIEAIHALCPGSYKKVFLHFDEIFWPKDPPAIGLILNRHNDGQMLASDDVNNAKTFPGNYLLLTNVWAKAGIPCLEVTLCGRHGQWAFNKSNEVIQNAILEFMAASMGIPNLLLGKSSPPSCIGSSVTRWEEDEFTRGSYSTFQLGTLDQHVMDLQQPTWDGRLLFAGEPMDLEHMGSVHGALLSGKQTAKKVSKYLSHCSS